MYLANPLGGGEGGGGGGAWAGRLVVMVVLVVLVVVVAMVVVVVVVVVVKAFTPSSLYPQDHTPSFTRPRLCSAPHSPYPCLQAHRAYTAVERPLGKGLGNGRRKDEGGQLDINRLFASDQSPRRDLNPGPPPGN